MAALEKVMLFLVYLHSIYFYLSMFQDTRLKTHFVRLRHFMSVKRGNRVDYNTQHMGLGLAMGRVSLGSSGGLRIFV